MTLPVGISSLSSALTFSHGVLPSDSVSIPQQQGSKAADLGHPLTPGNPRLGRELKRKCQG